MEVLTFSFGDPEEEYFVFGPGVKILKKSNCVFECFYQVFKRKLNTYDIEKMAPCTELLIVQAMQELHSRAFFLGF